jgi:DNA-binding NarL/FixJ family response regulator
VLLVESDRSTQDTMRRALRALGMAEPVIVATPGDAVAHAGGHDPYDVALVSLRFGPDATRTIAALTQPPGRGGRVVALSPGAGVGPLVEALSAGATSIIVSGRAEANLPAVPSTVHHLSDREIEVIRMVADGRSNKWIGARMDLSALTVKSHLARIGRKLGTGDRAQIVAFALRSGVIS